MKGKVLKMKKFFVSVVAEKSEPVISDFTSYEKMLEFYANSCLSLAGNKGTVLVYDVTNYGGIGNLMIVAYIDESIVYVTTGIVDDKRIINVTEKDELIFDASKRFESAQYEQAEADKDTADYSVYIGHHTFKYIGRDASDLVYKVLEGLFSSVSKDRDIITIIDKNTGKSYKIYYVKALYNCMIKINDGNFMSFEYYRPEKRCELMNYIRKEVIL